MDKVGQFAPAQKLKRQALKKELNKRVKYQLRDEMQEEKENLLEIQHFIQLECELKRTMPDNHGHQQLFQERDFSLIQNQYEGTQTENIRSTKFGFPPKEGTYDGFIPRKVEEAFCVSKYKPNTHQKGNDQTLIENGIQPPKKRQTKYDKKGLAVGGIIQAGKNEVSTCQGTERIWAGDSSYESNDKPFWAPKSEEIYRTKADAVTTDKIVSELIFDNDSCDELTFIVSYLPGHECSREQCLLSSQDSKLYLEEIKGMTSQNGFFKDTWENCIILYQHIAKCVFQARCYARTVFKEFQNAQQKCDEINGQKKLFQAEKKAAKFAELKANKGKKGKKGWRKGGAKGPQNKANVTSVVLNDNTKTTLGDRLIIPAKGQTAVEFEDMCVEFFWRQPATLRCPQPFKDDCYETVKKRFVYVQKYCQTLRNTTRFLNQTGTSVTICYLLDELEKIVGKMLRDQVCRALQRLLRMQIAREYEQTYTLLNGLQVRMVIFDKINSSFAMKTKAKDGTHNSQVPDFGQPTKTVWWFFDRMCEIRQIALLYKQDFVDCVKAKEQVTHGSKNFERGMYHLKSKQKQESQHKACPDEVEEGHVRVHGMKTNMLKRFNKLARQLGFDELKAEKVVQVTVLSIAISRAVETVNFAGAQATDDFKVVEFNDFEATEVTREVTQPID